MTIDSPFRQPRLIPFVQCRQSMKVSPGPCCECVINKNWSLQYLLYQAVSGLLTCYFKLCDLQT